ncbi:hypothetical protein ACFVVQ_21160 [Paenibacillus chitinolyticus]|uniref:hypothetical protein n=1 Tax=Paenibacillus chitinolyticus TaxID=79263 RepID=UPI0036D990E0
METAVNNTTLSIFFDESGKQNNAVQLMGALCFPTDIYKNDSLIMMHELNKEYSFHWTDYSGDAKMRNGIIKLFQMVAQISSYAQLNILHYHYSQIEADAIRFGSGLKAEIIEYTVYTKFPERIMYGLLREYDKSSQLNGALYIEHAYEYERLDLANSLKKQLNAHALYRGEPYFVSECSYKRKGEEIGVELTDLLLGIIRTIMENSTSNSRAKREQRNLIFRLYKMGLLESFIQNMFLYEWTGQSILKERNFKTYINLFIAKHFDEYKKIEV